MPLVNRQRTGKDLLHYQPSFPGPGCPGYWSDAEAMPIGPPHCPTGGLTRETMSTCQRNNCHEPEVTEGCRAVSSTRKGSFHDPCNRHTYFLYLVRWRVTYSSHLYLCYIHPFTPVVFGHHCAIFVSFYKRYNMTWCNYYLSESQVPSSYPRWNQTSNSFYFNGAINNGSHGLSRAIDGRSSREGICSNVVLVKHHYVPLWSVLVHNFNQWTRDFVGTITGNNNNHVLPWLWLLTPDLP